LTVKTSLIFGKRFTIFKTVNRFPKLNSSFLRARLISDCQNLAIVDPWNPTGAESDKIGLPESYRRRMPAGYDQILPLIGPDPEDSGWIQKFPARIRSNFLAEIRQRQQDVAGFRRLLPNSNFCIL
jgi:hypothetical protein